ncbi:MAG: glycosyltransferase [Saprospiraceae bacterium]
MLVFTIIAYTLAFCYVFIQGRFYRNWVEVLKAPPVVNPRSDAVQWSIIVPARNESARILQTLGSLPKDGVEIIVVNDHSTDDTAALVSALENVVLLHLPEALSGKKAALTYAIEVARGTWIATVDADVRAQSGWLQALETNRTKETVAIAGPVMLAPANSWFERWQALDFCGMMAITAASLRIGAYAMGNGANLAFSKAAFEAVGGYASPKGKESVSGDDMVLLGKLLDRYPGQIAFAKNQQAVVVTPPQPGMGSFVQQRWRWSAKTGLNQQVSLTVTLGLVWAFHVGLLVGIPLAIFGLVDVIHLVMAWYCKLFVDFLLLRSASQHFGRAHLLNWTYPLQSFVHALYVAGVGTLSLLPFEFEWKGRRARR